MISASIVMDILQTHPQVIIGGVLRENPFYVAPEEFLLELRSGSVATPLRLVELALRRHPAGHTPMPGFDAIADPQELRHCLRDLVALSTLPAIWRIYDSNHIAESAADTMLSILNCEYVFVFVPDQSIEVTKVARGADLESDIAITDALRDWLTHQLDGRGVISVALNLGTLRVASGPIGLGDKAAVVAASRQTNFPTAGQRLLLQTCANYVP